MSIQNQSDKIKPDLGEMGPETLYFDEKGHVERPTFIKRFFFGLLFILVGVLAFGIGRLTSQTNNSGVKIEFDPNLGELSPYQGDLPLDMTASANLGIKNGAPLTTSSTSKGTIQKGAVFASSKGKRYYYEGCKNTISAKNKIIFQTKEMAEKAGYTLAANCTPR